MDQMEKNQGSSSSEDYMSAWGLANTVCVQMTLRAAIELDVFNIIAKSGPGAHLTAKQIVSQMPSPISDPINASANLDRILRMLSVHSLLSTSTNKVTTTQQETTYGLTKETLCLVPNKDGVSLAPLLLLRSEMDSLRSLSLLKDTVLHPGCLPFDKAHGVNIYEYFSGTKPEQRLMFNAAMAINAAIFYDNVFEMYTGFREVDELIDVGGGFGSWLAKTVSVHPHIRGINFDLPNVIAQAPTHQGVKHVSGDMFQSIPKTKAIMLKCILHNWDDDLCEKLLRNCWNALPNSGKVIVVELAFPPVMGNTAKVSHIATLDIVMMTNYGGRERTTTEFHNLAKAAGFVETKVFPISNGCYVLEFLKRETFGSIV